MLQLLGLAILFFIVGNMVVEFQLFPYGQILRPAFAEWRAYITRRSVSGSPDGTNLWFAASEKPVGVTVNRPAERFDGYTLFTTPYPNGAVLVNPAGEVVHLWRNRVREVWPMGDRIRSPEPVKNTHWREVHLFPNGDVLTIYSSLGYAPYGHGFARLDKNARVIWKAPVLAHHDFDVGEEGEIYTLAHRYRDTEKRPVRGAAFYPERVQEDFVVELSPSGEIRRRVSEAASFDVARRKSPHRGPLRRFAPLTPSLPHGIRRPPRGLPLGRLGLTADHGSTTHPGASVPAASWSLRINSATARVGQPDSIRSNSRCSACRLPRKK